MKMKMESRHIDILKEYDYDVTLICEEVVYLRYEISKLNIKESVKTDLESLVNDIKRFEEANNKFEESVKERADNKNRR